MQRLSPEPDDTVVNGRRQGNKFDKILKENAEAFYAGLTRYLLHLRIVQTKDVPDHIQYTLERKPDFLKEATDTSGNTFLLHIEFQSENDRNMLCRVFRYCALLECRHRLPVKQYVLYLGRRKPRMLTRIVRDEYQFSYRLIAISNVDYRMFLRSNKPEEKMLAVLGNFGKEDPKKVLRTIIGDIKSCSDGDLAESRYLQQLHILVQLRNLEPQFDEIMVNLSNFFSLEKDPIYKRGQASGMTKKELEKNTAFTKTLLNETDFSVAKIAGLVGVDEDFVEGVKKNLK